MAWYKGFLLMSVFTALQSVMIVQGFGMFAGFITGLAFAIGYEAGKEDKDNA